MKLITLNTWGGTLDKQTKNFLKNYTDKEEISDHHALFIDFD